MRNDYQLYVNVKYVEEIHSKKDVVCVSLLWYCRFSPNRKIDCISVMPVSVLALQLAIVQDPSLLELADLQLKHAEWFYYIHPLAG